MNVPVIESPPGQRPSPKNNGVSDRFFRDLVAGLRSGAIAITATRQVAVMNDVAYRVLGIRQEESDTGRPYEDVLQSCPEIVGLLSNALDGDQLPTRAELRLRATGKVIGYTLSHIVDAGGELAGVSLLFSDLTRVEQIEERERLKGRLEALGEMAAAIAHEVKNPLAGIEVMAGLLKRRVRDHDAVTLLGDIIREAKMANAIVLEVLEFVRPIRLQLDSVSLPEVIEDAVQMAQSLVPSSHVEIEVTMPPDLPALAGDEHQLRQLFTNLLTNALEALVDRPKPREIHVTASLVVTDDEDDHTTDTVSVPTVVVHVVDSGPGIPEETRDRIFSPFFTTKPRGTGLGLANVRKVVDAHNGRIDLLESPGDGACFRVTLPLSTADSRFELASPQSRRAERAPAPRSAATRRKEKRMPPRACA